MTSSSPTITTRLAALSIIVLLALPGCDDPDAETEGAAPPDPSAAEVADEFEEAGAATGAFVADSWDRFQEMMDQRLAEADDRIEELQSELEARAEEMDAEARAAMNERLEDLRRQRSRLAEDFEETRSTAGSAWRDVAAGFQDAWRELDQGVSAAAARFEDDGGDGG